MAKIEPDSAQTCRLLEAVSRGDPSALGQLLVRYRPDMQAFVDCHLDPRLRVRVDGSDVVQEAQIEVVRRMDDFLKRRPMPFHLWVRRTAYERLLNLRRDHRKRARRSVDRCVPGRVIQSRAGSFTISECRWVCAARGRPQAIRFARFECRAWFPALTILARRLQR